MQNRPNRPAALETSKVRSGSSPSRRCAILSELQDQARYPCADSHAAHMTHKDAAVIGRRVDRSASGCEGVAAGVKYGLLVALWRLRRCSACGSVARCYCDAQKAATRGTAPQASRSTPSISGSGRCSTPTCTPTCLLWRSPELMDRQYDM